MSYNEKGVQVTIPYTIVDQIYGIHLDMQNPSIEWYSQLSEKMQRVQVHVGEILCSEVIKQLSNNR